jgi:hypothetical protein
MSSLKLDAVGSYIVWYVHNVLLGIAYYSIVIATNMLKLDVPVEWLTLPRKIIRETRVSILKMEAEFKKMGYRRFP